MAGKQVLRCYSWGTRQQNSLLRFVLLGAWAPWVFRGVFRWDFCLQGTNYSGFPRLWVFEDSGAGNGAKEWDDMVVIMAKGNWFRYNQIRMDWIALCVPQLSSSVHKRRNEYQYRSMTCQLLMSLLTSRSRTNHPADLRGWLTLILLYTKTPRTQTQREHSEISLQSHIIYFLL